MAFGFNTYTPPATKNLIIINCLCFLASIALPKFAGIDVINMLGLHYVGAEAFNPVQFLTYMFLHDTSGLTHIFFNMFGLWMFGRAIEEALGTRRFLVFYFVTGVGAAVVQEATWAYTLHPVINALNQYVNTRDITLLQPFLFKKLWVAYSVCCLHLQCCSPRRRYSCCSSQYLSRLLFLWAYTRLQSFSLAYSHSLVIT